MDIFLISMFLAVGSTSWPVRQFFPLAVCFSCARSVYTRVVCLDQHDARNRQQHGDKLLLQFINETQPALKIPAFIPLTDSCLKTCIITHHIRFSSLLAFIILHTGFHLSVSSFPFLSFFFPLWSVDFFFFFWPRLPDLQLCRMDYKLPPFHIFIVISEWLGLDPR